MGSHGGWRALRVLCTMLLGALAWAEPAAANSISVGDVQVTEGGGTVEATFRLTRVAGGLSGATTVSFETTAGTAAAPADYLAASGSREFGSALFGATQTHFVVVTVQADALDEADEAFRLVVSGAEVTDGDATATIVDDDPPSSLSVSNGGAVAEGAAGAKASFAVRLSAVSGRQVSVNYVTADAGATAGSDYAARSGTLVLAPGSTQGVIDVAVHDDGADEPSEGLELRLSSPLSATIAGAVGAATIVDDDEPPPPPGPPPPPPPAGPVTLPVLGGGSSTGSSSAGPTSGTAGRPSLGLSSPRLKRPSTVLVTLSCPQATSRCSGRMTIFTIPTRRSKLVALRTQRRLGRRLFVLSGGRSRTLQIPIGRADRALLNRTGRMRVRAYAVTLDSAGRTGVRSVNGTLTTRTAHSSIKD